MKTKFILLAVATVIIASCSKKNNYDFEGTYKMTSKEGWIDNNYCYIKKSKEDAYTISYHKDLDIKPKIVTRKGDTLFYKTDKYSYWLYILNSNKDTIDVKNNYDNSDVNQYSHKTFYVRQ